MNLSKRYALVSILVVLTTTIPLFTVYCLLLQSDHDKIGP